MNKSSRCPYPSQLHSKTDPYSAGIDTRAHTNCGETPKHRPAAAKNTYHYWPLQKHGWFRLLIIMPSPGREDGIHCSLIYQPIRGGLSFEALSYTWGSDKILTPIQVDGQVMHVRGNLLSALRCLRRPKDRRVIWIDALCINQQDPVEQTNQVSQMTDIYSTAYRVVVWLCESNPARDQAVEAMQEVSFLALAHEAGTPENRAGVNRMYNFWVDLVDEWLEYHSLCDCFEGVLHLFTQEWWSRAWTVQEITLAKNPVVQVGSQEVSWIHWETFSRLTTTYSVHKAGFRSPSPSDQYKALLASGRLQRWFVRGESIHVLRRRAHDGDEIPLSLMVDYTRSHLATDPRDKIYALLGMVNCGESPAPDYGADIRTVFTEAARCMLSHFGDWRLYNFSRLSHNSRTLPSWVPDFSGFTGDQSISLCFVGGSSRQDIVAPYFRPIYSAGGLRRGEILKAFIRFQNSDIFMLVAKGIRVDRVAMVCGEQIRPDNLRLPSLPVTVSRTLAQWRSHLGDMEGSYIAGGSRDNAFWRTVTLDCKVIGHHAGITLRDNPRDRRIRLSGSDPKVPPRSKTCKNQLIKALAQQFSWAEGRQLNRRFFTTGSGYMGLGPAGMQAGDLVAVLLGSEVPFVLRPCSSGRHRMVDQW